MSLTAGSLITSATQRAFGHIGPQKVSEAALLSELSYQDQLITQMFAQVAPDLLATVTGQVSITSAGNANGYTLPAGIHYRDFAHYDGDETYTPIELLQRQHRDTDRVAPAATLRLSGASAVLYPLDPLGKRWLGTESRDYFDADEGHVVTFSYVPLATPLTGLSSTLRSPDMAREVLVQSLVVMLMLSNPQPQQSTAALELALAARAAGYEMLRMQAYKFTHPAGQRPEGSRYVSESSWVSEQIG